MTELIFFHESVWEDFVLQRLSRICFYTSDKTVSNMVDLKTTRFLIALKVPETKFKHVFYTYIRRLINFMCSSITFFFL